MVRHVAHRDKACQEGEGSRELVDGVGLLVLHLFRQLLNLSGLLILHQLLEFLYQFLFAVEPVGHILQLGKQKEHHHTDPDQTDRVAKAEKGQPTRGGAQLAQTTPTG